MIAEYQQLTEKLFSCFSGDRATDETKPENVHFRNNAKSPHNDGEICRYSDGKQ